ncbi:MAG: hypothetical protein GF350_07295 [Chitinivibrionales bacterium]|nr:hypothetical protein [Chitinivibrionales bacterium]
MLHALLVICLGALPALSATIYVSPSGDDNSDGSEGSPFQTLSKARDHLRSIGPAGNTVVLRGGDYFLEETFMLDDRDGGTEQAPVTWKNYPGENPRIFGGTLITGWEPYQDNVYRAQLNLPSRVTVDSMCWILSENAKQSPHARCPNVFTGPGHGF